MMILFASAIMLAGAQKPPCKIHPCATDAQEKEMQYWTHRAKNLSDTATGPLLRYLDSKTFRDAIKGTILDGRASADVLTWYANNVRETSITHNFAYPLLKTVSQLNYKPNIWQSVKLNLAQGSKTQNAAETQLLYLPEFKKRFDPTWDETWDRPQYFSVNIWRVPVAQVFYGEINLVLMPQVKYYLLLSPVDTGGYADSCLNTSSSSSSSYNNNNSNHHHHRRRLSSREAMEREIEIERYREEAERRRRSRGSKDGKDDDSDSGTPPKCKVWNRDYGTTEFFHHLLLTHNDFYNYPLADLMLRALGKSFKDPWFYHHYYEANFMSTMMLPDHLNYVVANYSLWGKSDMQAFAAKHRRPLLWSQDFDVMIVDSVVGHINGSYVPSKADYDAFTKLWATHPAPPWSHVLQYSPALVLSLLRWGTCQAEVDYDYDGHNLDVKSAVSSYECCELCDNSRQCTAWTYRPDIKSCGLKTSNAGRKPFKNRVSGGRGKCPVYPSRNYIGMNQYGVCLFWMPYSQ